MAHQYKPEYQDCLSLLAGNLGENWVAVYEMFDEASLIANYKYLLSPLRRLLHSRNKELRFDAEAKKINMVPSRSESKPAPVNEEALFELTLMLLEAGFKPIRKKVDRVYMNNNTFEKITTTVDTIRLLTGQPHEALSSYSSLWVLTN